MDETIRTILVVEDDEYNFIFIEELLNERDNVKIIHARDGQDAVDIVKGNENISLIIMDIKLPELDGYTATEMIRENNPDIPVIAVTAYALSVEVEKYNKVFDEYLIKPLDMDHFEKVVLKYLN